MTGLICAATTASYDANRGHARRYFERLLCAGVAERPMLRDSKRSNRCRDGDLLRSAAASRKKRGDAPDRQSEANTMMKSHLQLLSDRFG
jgi:hypothetical protein